MNRALLVPVFSTWVLLACGDDSTATGGAGGEGGGATATATTTSTPASAGTGGAPGTGGGDAGGGAGGAATCPESAACGPDGLTCDPSEEYCATIIPGVPGADPSYSCQPLGACAYDDCDCILEAGSPDSCTPGGDDCLAHVDAFGA